MKKIFLVLVFSGLLFSAVPSWVQPGVSVVYDTYSAFVNDGSYQNAVYATLTINTNSISGNLVSGITYMEIPSIPGYITEYPWSCYEEDTCDWEFFVDVLNPTESITGPFGEEYTIIGNTNYSYGSVYFEDVTVMFYSNEETGVEYHVTFDSVTGLILAYAEIYPNQKTYLYFTSINTDLTQYSAPQYPQEDPNGFDQNGNGGDEPGVNDDGTNKKYEIGKICLSVFVLLFSLFSWIKK